MPKDSGRISDEDTAKLYKAKKAIVLTVEGEHIPKYQVSTWRNNQESKRRQNPIIEKSVAKQNTRYNGRRFSDNPCDVDGSIWKTKVWSKKAPAKSITITVTIHVFSQLLVYDVGRAKAPASLLL